jgi:catechol 2,3-dioxygenase-like lactoylglutathione lyase family enzyme
MINDARYAHTNLVARDWRTLATFYETVLGCRPASPEMDYSGPMLEAGTGVRGAALTGIHLRLPGGGPDGPTLEICSFAAPADGPAPAVDRPGLAHLAFLVPSVSDARREALAAGAQEVGDVVTITTPTGAHITWCYIADPEGNIVELQARS